MKNIHIKAYSLKKSNLNQGKPTISMSEKSGELNLSNSKKKTGEIKSPTMKSTNYQAKVNNLVNIQLFDKKLKSNLLSINSNNNSKSNSESIEHKSNTHRTGNINNNINIKFNINSEFIHNNNIKYDKNHNKKSSYVVNESQISKSNIAETKNNRSLEESPNKGSVEKNINYYMDLVKEKDKIIKNLSNELYSSKKLILQLSKENLQKITNYSQLSERELTLENSIEDLGNNIIKNSSRTNIKTNENLSSERTQNKHSITLNQFFKTNLKNSLNDIKISDASFRKNNKASFNNTSEIEISSRKYCPKTEGNIEDIIKNTVKIIGNKGDDMNEKMKNPFSENLKKIKERSHNLLEKYSENLIKLKNQIRNKSKN